MLAIIVAIVPAVLIAAVVMAYVAFPYRGERLPVLPGLGDLMHRGVESLPTLEGRLGVEDPADDVLGPATERRASLLG